jgi:predicted outer membrane repeat protein
LEKEEVAMPGLRVVVVVLLLTACLMAGCEPQVRVVQVTATPLPPTATPAPTTVTVCAVGCDFGTIRAAIDDTGTIAGSIINVGAGVYTEANISVDKDVIIQGEGADSTIVQAHNSADAAAGRVFFITNGATVTIRGMTIRHGNPPEHLRTGGGIYNDQLCTLTLENSIVANNIASDGAGINNRGTMLLSNCTITGNVADGVEEIGHECGSGGGIKSVGIATTVIVNCTINGNSAVGNGGGVKTNCDGTVEIINSTITGNNAEGRGGGVYARGVVTITNSTIVANNAVGISRHTGHGSGICVRDMLNFANTIVANNTGGPDCGICSGDSRHGTIGLNTNNLIGDGSCDPDFAGDPMLGVLLDNGNSPPIYTLLPGSPAIDAIAADVCAVGTDQRGVSRPQGSGCDIGAFELEIGE